MPGTNPFQVPPKAERVGQDKVRIDWSNSFSTANPACQKVDFMIKSHPRFQPAAYKLSDFTLAGKTSAVIQIDGGADYVFQVSDMQVMIH